MRMPESLSGLADDGLIDDVIRPLMSGKEAQVYLVSSGGELRVAKVYREATRRSFKHRAEYTEGRATRSSRDQRAMARRSRYGRARDEEAWRNAEVDTIYRLSAAGVRVPKPHHFSDGVLIMELVTGADGGPAPRLGDVSIGGDEAIGIHRIVLREVVRMLCAGVVHGDLSDFNVLLADDGPVIIDFPQSIDASRNAGARRMLIRDVENLNGFLRRAVPGRRSRPYGEEMWRLYERGELRPDTTLRGRVEVDERRVDLGEVEHLMRDAERDAARVAPGGRRSRRAGAPPRASTPTPTPKPAPPGGAGAAARPPGAPGSGGSGGTAAADRPRRRRRRRRPRTTGS